MPEMFRNRLIFLAATALLAGPAAEAQQEIGVPAAPVNHALTALLTLEAGLVRRMNMPIGSSLLVLAQKRT